MPKDFFFAKSPSGTVVKITTKHQVTIPTHVFQQLDLAVGDIMAAFAEGGRVVMVPKRLADRVPAARLSNPEQRLLKKAQQKIECINRDVLNSSGLTKAEIKAAIKAGLIERDQAWWWTEKSQKGYRESIKELEGEGLSKFFGTTEALKAYLTS